MVKNPPEIWETCVPSLGWEDPLEKEMATHSSILAWRIPWTEEPGRLQVYKVTKSQTQVSDFTFHFTFLTSLLCFQFFSQQGKSPRFTVNTTSIFYFLPPLLFSGSGRQGSGMIHRDNFLKMRQLRQIYSILHHLALSQAQNGPERSQTI